MPVAPPPPDVRKQVAQFRQELTVLVDDAGNVADEHELVGAEADRQFRGRNVGVHVEGLAGVVGRDRGDDGDEVIHGVLDDLGPHFHHVTHLHTQHFRSIAIDNCDLDPVFAVH